MYFVQKLILIGAIFSSTSIFAKLRYCANDEIRKKVLSSASVSEERYQSYNELEKVSVLKACFFGFKLKEISQSNRKFEKLSQLKELNKIKLKKLKRFDDEKIFFIACENRIKSFGSSDQQFDSSFLQRICENANRYSLTN